VLLCLMNKSEKKEEKELEEELGGIRGGELK
jgi:hypothetical protein